MFLAKQMLLDEDEAAAYAKAMATKAVEESDIGIV